MKGYTQKMKIKRNSRRKEKLKKRLVPLTILGLILLGVIYQRLAIYYNASNLGRMGRLIDINGKNIHLYDSGNSDIPIVFASDIGTVVPYADFYPLHEKLSQNHRVMIYDKPGYGWSDITNSSRDIDSICEEIHTTLHANDIPGDEDTYLDPFIYVAQGMGALEAIRYAQLYPEDILGLVFIEGTSPAYCSDYNNIMIIESFMTNALRNTGMMRLMKNSQFVARTLKDNPELPANIRALNRGLGLEMSWNRNVIAEKLKLPDNGQTVLSAIEEGKNLGDLPVRVITSEANDSSTWSRSQKSLLALSTDSEQSFIKGSTQYIETQDAPAIISTIETLIDYIHELQEDY